MSFYFLLMFIILLFETCVGLDPKFKACEPILMSCGNYGQNIRYPFYIKGTPKPFCGEPGFELTCGNNGLPILNIMGTPYTIHEIFYKNHSVRVSNAAFSQPNDSWCVAPTEDLIVGESEYEFRLAPNQTDLFVLYGCDLAALPERMRERRIGCSPGDETTSVVGLDAEDRDLELAEASCKGYTVNTTVEDLEGGVREALRKGFLLIWDAIDCAACTSDPVSKTTGHDLRVIATVCAATLGVAILSFIIYCIRKRLGKDKSEAHKDFEGFLKKHGPLVIRRYGYSDIKKMTNSFAEKLGQGGYGSVYKGKIHDGCLVAVKLLNNSKCNGEEFKNEVSSIGRTSHVNIVTLLGFCFEGSKRVLGLLASVPIVVVSYKIYKVRLHRDLSLLS